MNKLFILAVAVFSLSVFCLPQLSSALVLAPNASYYQNNSVPAGGSIEGIVYVPNTDQTLTKVSKDPFTSTSNAVGCLVINNATGVTVGSGTFVGNDCSVTVSLTGGTYYRIVANLSENDRNTFNNTLANTPGGFPSYPSGNFTGGCFSNGVDQCKFYTFNSTIYDIKNITLLDASGGNPLVLVTLNSPVNATVLSINNVTFNATGIPSYLNLTNATIFIYNSSSLFNRTTNVVLGNKTNITQWNITGFLPGTYLWNVRYCGSNSTSVNCSFAADNFSVEFGASILSETFNLSGIYETSRQSFSTIIDLLPGIELSLAQLVYNGTNYTVSSVITNGTNRILSRSIDLPVNPTAFLNTTNNFFWRFTFTNSQQTIQSTAVRQQNVSYINFQVCNGTFSTRALNFTFFDEVNQTNINAAVNPTTFLSSWRYWLGRGSTVRNYSFQNLSSLTNSYQLCIYPFNTSQFEFKTDSDISYSASGFRDNQYHLRNATLTNVTSNILLYLLDDNSATKFFLTFQKGANIITNATITAQKYFVGLGQFITTSILFTDSEGEATMWQDIDQNYKYTIVKDGVLQGVVEKTSICSVSPCSLFITIDESNPLPSDAFYDIYATNIFSNMSYNRTTHVITYQFVDITGLANYFRLTVTEVQLNQSGTGTAICDVQLASPAGSLTCNLTGYSGEFVAKGFISRSPEKLDQILNVLNEPDAIESLGLDGIFLIMAVIISVVFVAAILGRGSPTVVLGAFGISVLGLKLAHLFPFTWTVVVTLEVIVLFIISKVKN